MSAEEFPYRDALLRQSIHFLPRACSEEAIGREDAVKAAGWEALRTRHPAAKVEAWFGDVAAGYALRVRRRDLLPGHRSLPEYTPIPVWMVRFSNFEEHRRGRGGSRQVTEQFTILEARSGAIVSSFSFR